MYSRLIPLFILYGIMAASCSLPNKPPQNPITIPKTWHNHDHQFSDTKTNATCFAWWQTLHDPVLNQLIHMGLQQNNDIQIAISNIEAAQGELKKVQLNWLPTLTGNLGYSSFPYLGYPGILATVVPSYTLNIFTQINEQKRARYELAASKNIRDSVRLAVIAEISANYFSYLAQIERLHLLTQIKQDMIKDISIYQSAYEGGISTDIVLAKKQSQLNFIQGQEMIIRKNIVIHQNAIQFLLNRNPDTFTTKRTFSQLNSQLLVVGSLPFNVIENRPDMIQATHELQAANAGVGVAFSHFLPSVQLSLARGDIATVPNGTHIGQSIHFNQALLSAPLLTLSTFGDWDKARGLQRASYYRYQNKLRQVLKEVDDDLASHEYYSNRLRTTEQAMQHFQTAYQLHHKLYKQGIISYSELLQEHIELEKIKIAVNQHKLDQLISVVHLYQDLAVGYGCTACHPQTASSS